MAEYDMSWIRRQRIRWHTWRANRILDRIEKIKGEIPELIKQVKEHTKRAEELLEEAKW